MSWWRPTPWADVIRVRLYDATPKKLRWLPFVRQGPAALERLLRMEDDDVEYE